MIVFYLIAVATPKQIRDLMKVDGLTNDEVKSDLQVSNSPLSTQLTFIYLMDLLLDLICVGTDINSVFLIVQKYRLHNRRAPGSPMANRPIVLMGGLWIAQDQSSSQSGGSPPGPLHFSNSGVAVSSAATVSGEDEDGRSESYGWK